MNILLHIEIKIIILFLGYHKLRVINDLSEITLSRLTGGD